MSIQTSQTPPVTRPSLFQRIRQSDLWWSFTHSKTAMFSAALLAILILTALFAPLIAPQNPYDGAALDMWKAELPPVWEESGEWPYLLGTDTQGRDMLSAILYGTRISIVIGIASVALSLLIGMSAGLIAGYFGGFIDNLVSRLMDLILAFPYLLFSIALISVVPVTTAWRIGVVVGVISFFSWPYIGRIVRGQTLSLREREFVEAARSVGAGPVRILFRELLPNLVAPILVYATLVIPTNIVFEASLSFLGVGVLPPTPSWGRLLSDAVNFYTYDPVYMFVPGLAIFIMVLAFNLFGDGLRDALDPKANR